MSKSQEGPLPPPEHKAVFVHQLFTDIARRYDLMNGLMSLGRDSAWRRYTVAQASTARQEGTTWQVLDVATGTGDLGLEVLRQQPDAQVVGVDFVPDMMLVAQEKARQKETRLHLAAGDALRLPFADGLFDSVVTGFAMRNVTDIPAAFAEMARVTRPGGRVACLEIAKPRQPIFRPLFEIYFYRIVPILGSLITGKRSAYVYLPHSLTAFLTPDQIVAVMNRTGWQEVRYRRLMFGTVAVHVGVRSEVPLTQLK